MARERARVAVSQEHVLHKRTVWPGALCNSTGSGVLQNVFIEGEEGADSNAHLPFTK